MGRVIHYLVWAYKNREYLSDKQMDKVSEWTNNSGMTREEIINELDKEEE